MGTQRFGHLGLLSAMLGTLCWVPSSVAGVGDIRGWSLKTCWQETCLVAQSERVYQSNDTALFSFDKITAKVSRKANREGSGNSIVTEVLRVQGTDGYYDAKNNMLMIRGADPKNDVLIQLNNGDVFTIPSIN